MNSNIRPQDLAASPSRSRTNVILVTDVPRYDLNASVRWGGKKPQKIYIGSTPALLARAIEQNLDSGLYILLLQILIVTIHFQKNKNFLSALDACPKCIISQTTKRTTLKKSGSLKIQQAFQHQVQTAFDKIFRYLLSLINNPMS